jgi:hypothetical protein
MARCRFANIYRFDGKPQSNNFFQGFTPRILEVGWLGKRKIREMIRGIGGGGEWSGGEGSGISGGFRMLRCISNWPRNRPNHLLSRGIDMHFLVVL